MNEMKNYVDILKKSLEKKLYVLKKIEELNISQNVMEEQVIDNYLDEKEKLLKELEKLDEGFETVYKRVAVQLKQDKEMYRDDIVSMQSMIKQITDITVRLQVEEQNLKSGFDNFCNSKKEEIKKFKMSKKTVSNYYKNMKNMHQEEQSYFLDKKN